MTNSQPLILPFSAIRANDLPLVGGKGANLGEMTHAGFPIPTGFCLTTIAFKKFMDLSAKANEVYEILDTITSEDLEKVRTIGESIRQKLLDAPVPDDIATIFKKYWEESGTDLAYSVRSSATAEDLPDASFAGQQDTYLNVIGEADLLDAIRRCWVSLFTDRAILYRHQHHFDHRDVQLSVVVQAMVQSEKSGILFTADPLTGHRHTLSIDASFGLGEALVSGLVNPDAYQVNKLKRTIIQRQIAEKEVAIFSEKDGGTRTEKLSEIQRKETVLSDEQILELSDIACKIETHYDAPQDIEWAFANNQFYILQSRPITSLYPIDKLQSPDGSLQIYFSFGHQQMMTKAMSPLSLSTFQCIFPFGRSEGKYETTIVHQNGGRLYLNLTEALRHPFLHKMVFTVIGQFDALGPKTLQKAMRHEEFKHPHSIKIPFSFMKNGLGIAAKVMHSLWFQNLDGFIPKINLIKAEYLKGVAKEIDRLPNGKAKIQHVLDNFSRMIPVALNWIPKFVASELAKRMLGKLASTADPADLDAVSLGLAGNVVTEMNLAVGDLADTARQHPDICQAFQNLDKGSQAWLEQVANSSGSDAFLSEWNNFLKKYGARGPSEIDIMVPRWVEEPLPLLQMIAGYLQKEPGSHRKQHHKLEEQRQAASKKVLAEASKGLFAWLKKPLVKRLLYVIEQVGGLREHHKFMAIQILLIAKKMLKDVSLELTEQQKIAHPDDIWFLSWSELLTIWEDTASKQEIIDKRKEDLKRYQKLNPPVVITSDGETPIVQYEIADVPEGALVGNPVSGGVVEGMVKLVHDPHVEILKPGEILVATFTDPGWTPLFINAGGLILAVGGIMTHGSVVAREYGIPAVVGVRDVMDKLKTGQKVRVDGDRGIIEILED